MGIIDVGLKTAFVVGKILIGQESPGLGIRRVALVIKGNKLPATREAYNCGRNE